MPKKTTRKKGGRKARSASWRPNIRGERIRERCAAVGMTQRDLAFTVGVHESEISDLVNGRRDVMFGLVRKIATVLQCSMDYLGGVTDNPEVNR